MARADGTTLYTHLRRILCAGALAGAADEDLLAQFVARRDEAAFAVLLRRHGPMVWGVCRRLLIRPEDAEDAFQATFLLLAKKAASIQQPQLLANWLFGVARRLALTARARAARHARRERSFGHVPEVPVTPVPPCDDVRAIVDEELARMPTKYRLPMLLCALEGMTQAEAGKLLGWPTGTLSARLSRGRRLLRTRLMRRGVTVTAPALAAMLAAAGPPARAAAAVLCAATAIAIGKRWLAAAALVGALTLALGGAGAVWCLTRPAATTSGPAGGLARQPPPPVVVPEPPRPAVQPAVRLPADPDAVVLHMDRTIGSEPRPCANLTIYADGRVVAEVPDGLLSLSPTALTRHAQAAGIARARGSATRPRKTAVLRGRLSARELDELLRFAVHDQEFFDFDSAQVQDAIRQAYHRDDDPPDAGDATTTRFHVHTAGRVHEVEWLRLARGAWTFPEVRRLLQLYALDRRLQQVFYVLVAGGPEQVEAVVTMMNRLAQPYYRRYPNAPRLTAADLFCVTRSEDGTWTRYAFSRNHPDGLVRHPLFEIAIDVPLVGEPRIGYVMPPGP
jgi:RNA polymerase sigma factor (sigma-70 family)